jgi:hypothetical protein
LEFKGHVHARSRKVASDIVNMYSNVPTNDLTNIIDLLCTQHDIKEERKHELKKIS